MEPFFCPSTRKNLPGNGAQPYLAKHSWYSQKALPSKDFGSYLARMTKLLEKAFEAVRRLPPDSQDQIARAMLTLTDNDGEPEKIDPGHLADVLEGLAEANHREFATEAEFEAAFRRFEQ